MEVNLSYKIRFFIFYNFESLCNTISYTLIGNHGDLPVPRAGKANVFTDFFSALRNAFFMTFLHSYGLCFELMWMMYLTGRPHPDVDTTPYCFISSSTNIEK